MELRAAIIGHNPLHLLQLSMLHFPWMVWVKWPVANRIQPQSNKFATGARTRSQVTQNLMTVLALTEILMMMMM